MKLQTADVQFMMKRNTSDEELQENLRINLAGKRFPSLKAGRALIVGGGPSVIDYIDDIRKKKSLGFTVFALNGAGKFLNIHGIVPNYLVIYDARPDNASFLEAEADEYLVASYSHPSVFDSIKGKNIKIYHVVGPQFIIDEVRSVEPDAHFLGGGSTVGMQMLNILIMLGYRVAHLYGYDSSDKEDSHHAYPQTMNDELKRFTFEFRGKYYKSDMAMAAQAREFVESAPQFERLGLSIFVFGDGLLPDMWRAEKERQGGNIPGMPLEQSEREKYEQIWEIPGYRNMSPGEDLIPSFHEACKPAIGDTILDLGCGTGRATAALTAAGFPAIGVDHASNCLDSGVDIEFKQHNLWELPEELVADWVYCCDVMEHIPPEKVDEVLSRMNKACKKGAFFNISFEDDFFGSKIGQKLHLTVRNYQWWIEKLEQHFGDTITYYEGTGVFCSLKGAS